MTSFSKFFNDSIWNKTCQELFHPSTSSCHRSLLNILWHAIPGNVKLFLTYYVLVPLVYNGRDNNYPNIKQSFEFFIKELITAFGFMMSNFYLMCLLNQILGKFYVYTIVLVPSILCSPILFFSPSKFLKSHAQACFCFVLEAAIKNSKNPVIKAIRTSKIATTFLFMCISGSIMYYLKKNIKYSLYWFTQPTKCFAANNNSNKVSNNRYVENPEFPGWGKLKINEQFSCDHNDLCDKYVINGLFKYGKFGLGLEITKRIISSASLITSNPLGFLRNIVFSTNYRLVKFMVAYGVLYRLSNCFFNRKFGEETPKTSLLAGIVSGVAFSMAPNYSYFTYGIAAMVQLMWHALGAAEPQSIPHFEKLYNLPWSVILYSIFGGLAMHIRLFKPQLLPKIAVVLLDIITNGHMKLISERINTPANPTACGF